MAGSANIYANEKMCIQALHLIFGPSVKMISVNYNFYITVFTLFDNNLVEFGLTELRALANYVQ